MYESHDFKSYRTNKSMIWNNILNRARAILASPALTTQFSQTFQNKRRMRKTMASSQLLLTRCVSPGEPLINKSITKWMNAAVSLSCQAWLSPGGFKRAQERLGAPRRWTTEGGIAFALHLQATSLGKLDHWKHLRLAGQPASISWVIHSPALAAVVQGRLQVRHTHRQCSSVRGQCPHTLNIYVYVYICIYRGKYWAFVLLDTHSIE